ncbi:MAG: hypothetical protein KME54_09325 [Tolypothrix brevis GSE-NOS-MK-07-07A]|nr:hypothetical protein [Tolypothrix brevis GSE-NOS-MK-07-07A]
MSSYATTIRIIFIITRLANINSAVGTVFMPFTQHLNAIARPRGQYASLSV